MNNLPAPNVKDRQMGYALLRFILGINMLTRSLVRLPDVDAFASGMADGFADTFLPAPFVYLFAWIIVITETIVGILLIIGWKTRWALLAMGLLMASLAFGQILQQNFGTVANILIYAIAVSLLLFKSEYDFFGIDKGFRD